MPSFLWGRQKQAIRYTSWNIYWEKHGADCSARILYDFRLSVLPQFHLEKAGRKWKARIRSVLVPYLLWNGLYYLGYVIGSRLPGIGDLMGKGVIPFHLEALADAVIHHTYLYVFWYLYQLIFLIAPGSGFIWTFKNIWSGSLYLGILLILLWFTTDLPIINEDALFYYSAAGFAALRSEKWVEQNWSGKRFLAGLMVLMAAAVNFVLAGKTYQPFYTVLYRFLAVMGLWMIVDEGWLGKPKRMWMEYNFFLYALHFAFVRLIRGAAVYFHRFFAVTEEQGRRCGRLA